MKLDQYELTSDEQATTFEFVSEGPKGKIVKQVHFSLFGYGIYNLGFGDKDIVSGEIDDKVITDNGDSERVQATVVEALYKFCEMYPDAKVYATGSTTARTRLYRMGINRYYDIANADFEIAGQTEKGWEPYQKGKDYKAFMVKRKKLKFEL